MRAGMSPKKGCDLGVRRRGAHRRRARARDPPRAPAATMASRARSSARQQLDRGRHDVAHHPRALAAAEDEQPEACRRAAQRRTASRAASSTAGRTGLPVWTQLAPACAGMPLTSGKPVAMAATRRREQPVGPAHHAVLLVDHGRDAAQRRGQHRRHGRVAAEADDRRRASSGAARRLACSRPAPSMSAAFAICSGEPPDGVADGISMHLLGREAPAIARRRARRSRARPQRRARFSASASASAGNRWPPVPPAARRMSGRPVIARGRSRSSRVRSSPARGRRRVSASRSPSPSASEISDEPP